MRLDPLLIRSLLDREAIIAAANGLLWTVDMKQWESFAAFFASGATISWPSLADSVPSSIAAFTDSVSARLRPITTFHQCTNPLITLEQETATVRYLLTARHRRATMRGGDTFTALAEHIQTLQRAGADEWKITAIRNVPLSAEGNPGVLEGAAIDPVSPVRARTSLPALGAPATDAERLHWLGDRMAIHDLMMRFGRGLDTKDWELYRSCFADSVTIDFSETTGRPARPISADRFVEFASVRQRSHGAFHQYSNFQVWVAGDQARCLLYLVARHRRASETEGDPLNVFVGWYDNEFVRTQHGWRISILRHPLQWVEGNATIKDAPDPVASALGEELFSEGAD